MNLTELMLSAVPDDCALHVPPPLLVCRIVPPPPTTHPLLASTKLTPNNCWLVPLDWAIHVPPESVVRRMAPLLPTAQPSKKEACTVDLAMIKIKTVSPVRCG